MIENREIKSVGLAVPAITFGAASIGNLFKNLSNVEALNTVQKGIDVGWRFFDTAPHYGSGLSERRLGLGLRGLERDQYVLSTKVGRLLVSRRHKPGLDAGDFFYEEGPFDRHYDYSYDGIMRSWEDSIQRMGVRYIDILHVHDLGEYTHSKGADERRHFKDFCDSGVKALEELKAAGEIKAWGMGANEQEIFMEALEHVTPDIFMLANRYNLLETDREQFFDRCREKNISVSIAAPFATGILVSPEATNGLYEYGKAPDEIIAKVKKIDEVCRAYNIPMGAAALQFPLRKDVVVSVTCGVQSIEQAITNYEWASIDIPEAFWNDLAKI